MCFFLLVSLPLWLFAQTYTDLLHRLESSYRYKSAQALTEASESLYQASQGKNLPTLDATLSAIEFNEIPNMTLHMPSLFPNPITAPVGTKKHVEGALILTYPLFTGFAISSSIDKAKLEHEEASLKLINLKRNLAMQTTLLYSTIIAEEKSIRALKSSQEAIQKAYLKAKGFYDNGMLAPSELSAIEAKKYDIDAQIMDHENARSQYLNQLSALLSTPVTSIEGDVYSDAPVLQESEALHKALEEREDVQAMQKSIDVAQSSVELAKSKNYPTVALIGMLKHQGDSLALNGDGYTNADKSYLGLNVTYTLFNGFSDAHAIDAARASKMSAIFDLQAYQDQVKTEVTNGFLELRTLEKKLQSAKEEFHANETYSDLSQGRFNNQLISADELSRAIASKAASEAKVAAIQSQLFNQHMRLWLLCGWNSFEKLVHLN